MKLIAGMICRNEIDRYLKQVINNLFLFCDKLIIIDDKSDDKTFEYLSFLIKINKVASEKIILYQMDKPTFIEDELKIRLTLWDKIKEIATEKDWILISDADEIISQKYHNQIRELISKNQNFTSIAMKLYNMWDDNHYRIDGAWNPNDIKRRLFKFKKSDIWLFDRKISCGEVPKYVWQESVYLSDIKLKHLAYMKEEDRIKKHKFYMRWADGNSHARYHLESIIQKPVLEKYED